MKRYKESNKEIFNMPSQMNEFLNKMSSIDINGDSTIYVYDDYSSGATSVLEGNCKLKMGAFIISKNKNYVSLNLKQVKKIEFSFDDKWFLDFSLKSGGSATIVFG